MDQGKGETLHPSRRRSMSTEGIDGNAASLFLTSALQPGTAMRCAVPNGRVRCWLRG